MAIDMDKLNAFIGQFVGDLGAAVGAGMVVIGERLGLYKALVTPCSRSQEVGLCLGAQSGEASMREVVTKAGFSRFRRATETPFNIVYEARP